MKTWRFGILMLSLLLAGCGAVDFPLGPFGATPTPTQTLTPTPTPTQTPTPTPSPTPTPTPVPSEVLAMADHARFIGDWETASQLYGRLRTMPGVTADDRAQSVLGQAQALLSDEAYTKTVELLSSFVAELSATEAVTEAQPTTLTGAHLLLADALLASDQPIAATEHYSQVLELAPLVSPYAYEWLGDAFHASGVYTAAVKAYTAAITEVEATSQKAWLYEKVALSLASNGDYTGAVAAYDAILAIAQYPEYRAGIMSQAAEAALVSGEVQEAYDRMLELVIAYPEDERAHNALVTLVEAGVPVDDGLRGLVDYYAEAYGPAVQAFYRQIQDDPAHTGEPHYYAGLSFLKAGSLDLALDEFELIIETHPGDPYIPDAWMGIAAVRMAQGNAETALEAYSTGIELYPERPEIPEVVLDTVELFTDHDDFATAAQILVDLATRYPDDERAPETRFRAGLLRYRAGDIVGAQADWQALTAWYPYAEATQAAWYWLGKTYAMGEDDVPTPTPAPDDLGVGTVLSSTEAFSQAVSLDPWGFYGLQAADRLAERSPFEAYAEPLNSCNSTEARQEAESWLATWLQLDSTTVVGDLPASLLNDERLRRGTLLLQLGHFEDGRSELEQLRIATADDPLIQYRLALYFREIGLYRSSIIAAATVWQHAPIEDFARLPRFIGCLAYPTYYAELVAREAAAHELSPLFIYALLRQESLFEGDATSFAAAHGLMQVIPSTGAYIAESLGWPADYRTRDLYRPMVSVKFGIWYLVEQLGLADGNLFVAMAAYNGGPGNALRWWDAANGDTDLFVELIDFTETRKYIRLIREHYAHYRWLYTRPGELMVPAPTLRESS
ncbi:MAG: transglycosylase SLT domain-containing protein [Anaerolineae bacterium]